MGEKGSQDASGMGLTAQHAQRPIGLALGQQNQAATQKKWSQQGGGPKSGDQLPGQTNYNQDSGNLEHNINMPGQANMSLGVPSPTGSSGSSGGSGESDSFMKQLMGPMYNLALGMNPLMMQGENYLELMKKIK